MNAVEVLRERLILGPGEFIEVVIWQVSAPVPPSDHDFKSCLVDARDRLRIADDDNQRSKMTTSMLPSWESTIGS